jgi:hypothetical protein
LIFQAGDTIGKTYRTAYGTKKWMEDAGFINVVEKDYKFPIGKWPADTRMKELGMWFRAYFEDGMEGYAMALLTRVLKVSCCLSFLYSVFVLANTFGGLVGVRRGSSILCSPEGSV